jgi:putative phosphoserine phosphatase/1-acylglycerol-3-phosphate O-acyltransferase
MAGKGGLRRWARGNNRGRGAAAQRGPREGPWAYRLVAMLVTLLVRPFVHIDGRQLQMAEQHRTAVVVANHRSYFDAIVGLVVFHRLRRYPRVIVASHWFERRTTGMLLRSVGAIPMDRDNPAVHLEGARRVLDADIPILVMPEGVLSGIPGDPTSLGHFKTGAVRLADYCDVQIWTLALVGSDVAWPQDRRFPRFGLNPRRRHHVVVLGDEDLIPVDGDAIKDTERVREQMVKLLHEAADLRSAEAGAYR